MPICIEEKIAAVDSQAEHPVSNPEDTLEAETSDCQQHEPAPSETAEPERAVSPQKEPVPEESSPAQPDSSTKKPDSSTRKKLRSSPGSVTPLRRSARRPLQHDKTPSPKQYSGNLRSSINGEERSKRTKSAARIDLQKEDRVEQPPSKKARGKRISESPNKAIGAASASETG